MFLINWLAFFLLWAVMFRCGMGLRAAFLAAQAVNGALIVAATEGLSAFHALSWGPLTVFWSLICLLNLVCLHLLRQRPKAVRFFVPFTFLDKIILVAVGIITAVTGVVALISPPNNYDSMIYHMARVAHWAHNGTVANYPTHTLLQLVIPPFSAYAILQTYILSGSDRLANLVQWNSLVASLVGVSLAAEILGGARRAQLIAVLFAATLPMSILQASSTQNDLVATMWSACTTVFALLMITTGGRRWGLLCALSLGLAAFTKGTALIISVPFLIWAFLKVRWGAGHKIAWLLLLIFTTAALNAGFLQRLKELHPDPFQAMQLGGSAVVEHIDWRGLISNAVRGMATALSAPSLDWDRFLLRSVELVHQWIGISASSPGYSVPGSPFSLWYHVPVLEDFVSSWLHSVIYLQIMLYLLILGFIGNSPICRRPAYASPSRDSVSWKDSPVFWQFVGTFLAAFVLFCSLVKWQPWITRFQLPFFVLFSAVAGVVLEGLFVRSWLPLLTGACLFTASLSPLFLNPQRPLFPYGALSRTYMASTVPRGGEIFDWLKRNGCFQQETSGGAYLGNFDDADWESLRQAYPDEYNQARSVLRRAASCSRGIFSVPREELLFGRFGKLCRDEYTRNFKFMREQLKSAPECRDIGFIAGPLKYEYPFWALLNTNRKKIRIEHILVNNESGNMDQPRDRPEPCMIILEGEGGETMQYEGRIYRRSAAGPFLVYVDPGIAPLQGFKNAPGGR